MKPKRRLFLTILLNIVLTIVLLLTIEGFSSVVVVVKQIFFSDLLEERKHTQYDEEIGWINLPNLNVKDMYGPGRSFRSNSQAYRNDHDVSAEVPPDKVRLVCSGDSFTMGYGVDNDAGWCAQLGLLEPQFEPVNLGQGGYGVDQAYLWYKRNSPKLQHDIQLFAFITDDFKRMESDTFLGYGKPFLKVENGNLVNKNRPVPRLAFAVPRLPRIREGVGNLSVVKLFRRLRQRFAPAVPTAGTGLARPSEEQKDSEAQGVVEKMFDDLKQTNQNKNSVLVLVYLPKRPDDTLGKETGPWLQFVHAAGSERKIPVIDMVEEVAKLPPQDTAGFYSDNGHYSEKGNRIFAKLLYKQLQALPEIQAQFQKKHLSPADGR